ncbi:MAG: hypothetical protein Q4C71_00950 [Microbacteriaceae bacterium]|nr:hypothetical protein [Microbacteriaceae bacterium]
MSVAKRIKAGFTAFIAVLFTLFAAVPAFANDTHGHGDGHGHGESKRHTLDTLAPFSHVKDQPNYIGIAITAAILLVTVLLIAAIATKLTKKAA